jgi:hypothetical protein
MIHLCELQFSSPSMSHIKLKKWYLDGYILLIIGEENKGKDAWLSLR